MESINIIFMPVNDPMRGGRIAGDSILASRPAAPGSILGVPKIFSEKILDVVDIYRQRVLLRQWTVQSLI